MQTKLLYIFLIFQILLLQILGISLHICNPCGSHLGSYVDCICDEHVAHAQKLSQNNCQKTSCKTCSQRNEDCTESNFKLTFLQVKPQNISNIYFLPSPTFSIVDLLFSLNTKYYKPHYNLLSPITPLLLNTSLLI